MLSPVYTKQFEKDLKRAIKRGKDGRKIKEVMRKLMHQEPLDPKHRDHKLIGNWKNRRDCHIEPDWILIYKLEEDQGCIIFERTGTHSDLFR